MQIGACNRRESPDPVRLLFVGSPLLDVTSECVTSDLLREYSLVPDGCVPASPEHEALFERLFRDPRTRKDAGGSALNSAKVAKWTAGGRQAQVAFAGCVGQDDCATLLESELRDSGVEPLLLALSDGSPTGLCACLLMGHARSMVTRRGASALFSPVHLEAEDVRRWVLTSQVIFVVGYFASHSPEVLRALAERHSSDQLFTLSLSAEYICRDFVEVILSVMPKVDILFGNGGEVLAFAEAAGLKDASSTAESAALALSTLEGRCGRDPPRIVVVTQGPDPVILVKNGQSPRHFSVPPTPILDSVGCGDALAGAFLAVYAITGDEERAVRAGIRAAVEIAQVNGCCLPEKEIDFFSCTG